MRFIRKSSSQETDQSRTFRYVPAGWRLAILISLALAASIPLVVFALLFPLVENFPRWDQWHLLHLWEAYYSGQNVMSLLLEPYNGHLNVIPRFIFFGMGVITRWDVRFEVVLSFIFALVTLVVLLVMLRKTDLRLLVLAAPVSAQVFSIAQFENFLSGYPLGQNLSQMTATLAIYFLVAPGRKSLKNPICAFSSSLIATFSWGAGLVAWFAGAIALIMERPIRWALLAVWCLTTIGITGVVAAGVGRSALPLQWKRIFSFVTVLVGRSFSMSSFPPVSEAGQNGFLILLILLAVLAICLKMRLWVEARPWILLAALSFGSVLLIALGRFSAGIQQALVSHYITSTYPLIVVVLVLVSLCLIRVFDSSVLKITRSAVIALSATLSIAVTAQPIMVARTTIPVLRHWADLNASDTRKVILGVATDTDIHRTHHPDAALVRWGTSVLLEHRLTLFKDALDDSSNVVSLADRSNPAVPLPSSAFVVEWKSVRVPQITPASSRLPIEIEVKNASSVPWPARKKHSAAYAVRLAYRWIGAPPPWNDYDNHRIDFSSPVPPGKTVWLKFEIEAPAYEGQYALQFDLVQELVAWFESKNADVLRVRVHVSEPMVGTRNRKAS